MFRSSCNILALSILLGLSSMSCCYFQISTSVLWLIIIVPRVAPIAQTLWGHSTAPAKLNISGMELNVKVCFLYLCLIKFLNQLEIAVFLAVCLVVWAFIFSTFCVSICSSFCFLLKRWNRSLPSSRTSVIWCRNYGVRTRLRAKSPSSVYRIKSRANERKFPETGC